MHISVRRSASIQNYDLPSICQAVGRCTRTQASCDVLSNGGEIWNRFVPILLQVVILTFLVDSFSEFCLQTLEEAISVQTACEILALLEEQYESENASVVTIVRKCYKYLSQVGWRNASLILLRYILDNISAIIQEDTLYALSSETFQSILQHPSLTCPEIQLYNAVLSWHQHHHGDFNTHRESLLLHLSKLDLRLIDLNSLAERVHASGVFSKDEMAEVYRLRISLGQFSHYSRNDRKVFRIYFLGIEKVT